MYVQPAVDRPLRYDVRRVMYRARGRKCGSVFAMAVISAVMSEIFATLDITGRNQGELQ